MAITKLADRPLSSARDARVARARPDPAIAMGYPPLAGGDPQARITELAHCMACRLGVPARCDCSAPWRGPRYGWHGACDRCKAELLSPRRVEGADNCTARRSRRSAHRTSHISGTAPAISPLHATDAPVATKIVLISVFAALISTMRLRVQTGFVRPSASSPVIG